MSENTIIDALHAARTLFQPGDVVEIRVPKAGRQKTISGYFDDLEKLAQAVGELENSRFPGIYWTLNPVGRALLSRAENKVKPFADYTTGDSDILRRQLLGVDFDPKRPTGISSTNEEHEAALALAGVVRNKMLAEGWPEPIFADSGNGAHLVYPIELPNDLAAAELLKRVLRALAARFNTPMVEVDRTTFNASRIFKTYGTTARKGDNTADRAHRVSHILEMPALLTRVSLDLLQSVAASVPPDKPRQAPRPAGRRSPPIFDLQHFLDQHGISHRAPVAHEGGLKYVLEQCPFNPEHKAPDAAVFLRADGSLGFKCFHNSCEGRQWRDFRDLFQPNRPRSPGSSAPAPPFPAPEPRACDSDEIPLSAGDVEAAIDAAINTGEKGDLDAAMRLIPEIAKLPRHNRALIQGKLRLKFKRAFPSRDFSRAVEELADKHAEPPPEPPDDDGAPPSDAPDLLGYPLTDSGNGERIVALYPNVIRFCTEFDKWLIWDGRRWKVDVAREITQKAKAMARLLYEQAGRHPDGDLRKILREHARASESQAAIVAALKRAASEPGIPVSAADLDLHRYLLNCLNGVVDVRTGELLQFDPKYLITKLCHVKYSAAAVCPRFLKFLNWAMGELPDDVGNDREKITRMVDFLQKAFGYSLTGDVSEKAAFIFYGRKGNNGKTTLLTIFTTILAEYATQLDINTLMSSKFTDNNVRADMAKLHGARMVITSEVDDQQRLSERLLKYLTAGMGKITACRKFENPIEFDATHKIFMDANYRPNVRGADEAIWSRLKCIQFEQRIEEEDPDLDKKLKDKILAESEGVLAWAVRGAMRWTKEGKLGPPPEVKQATSDWRESDDPIKEFLEDCCDIGAEEDEFWVLGSELSAAYADWTKKNTETRPLSRSQLSERLELKGFRKNRSRRDSSGTQMRTWEGLKVKQGVTSRFSGFGDSPNG